MSKVGERRRKILAFGAGVVTSQVLSSILKTKETTELAGAEKGRIADPFIGDTSIDEKKKAIIMLAVIGIVLVLAFVFK